jgi:hypothetical protein
MADRLDRRRFDCEVPEVVATGFPRNTRTGATVYQNLMRQNPDLTRSDATGPPLLRLKCPQSHSKKTKQGSAFVEFTEIPGGLNWSVQHYLEVYLPEFESPKFVAGVD